MSRRLRLVLAVAAVAAGQVNLALILRAGDARPRSPAYLLIAIIGVSWSFVAAGLVAWSRRPENRTGALMVAVGLAYALLGLRLVGTPVAFTLYLLLASLPVAVLAHLIAVFPDGRASTRLQRVFLVANYATTVPLAFVQLLLVDPRRLRCAQCPAVLVGKGGTHPYGEAVVAGSDLLDLVLAGLLLWIVVTRWRRAPAPRRRGLAPVVQVAVVLLVLYITRQALEAVASSPPAWIGGALDLAVLTTLMLWPLGFLAGLARTRLDRSAVGDLAIELDGLASPDRLEQALARALHDPTVQLAYWLPDQHGFVDAAGRPVELPPAGGGRAVTIVRHDGQAVAALVHDAALRDEPELVHAVAATARLTIENQRLQAEVRAQLEQVRASRARIVEFGDAERRRVERNLHDGAQQRLVNLSLALGIARSQVPASDEQLAAALDEAAAELRLALAELRELARGIHPVILSEAGLGPALASLAERSPVPATVAAAPPDRLPARVEETAYYVASEALTNAAKHAHATAVSISAHRCDRGLVVEVGDDGVGGADPTGSGLRGLADRVAAVDGRLRVHSPVGQGTRITAELPCGW
ncbi:MAG TPA: histidine kinase [Actinomycetes bacterium]